jgi:hypothetical protein
MTVQEKELWMYNRWFGYTLAVIIVSLPLTLWARNAPISGNQQAQILRNTAPYALQTRYQVATPGDRIAVGHELIEQKRIGGSVHRYSTDKVGGGSVHRYSTDKVGGGAVHRYSTDKVGGGAVHRYSTDGTHPVIGGQKLVQTAANK